MKHHRVYRTELTPVSFLDAQRLRLPRQDRRRPRRAALHLPAVRGAREPARLRAARGRAAASTIGWPSSARTSRRCSRRTTACPPRAASWSRSTRGSPPTRSATSSSTPGSSFLFVDAELEHAGQAARPHRPARRAHRRHRRGRRSLRGLPGRGLARARRELARGRGGDDLDQLHLGHDRAAQGRDVHAPRRLAERARRGVETGMSFDTRYLWTLPMFHCNGWCFTWAVTAVGGTHVCLRRGRARPHLGAASTRRASPTTTARPPCRSAWSTTRRRTSSTRPVTVTVAGAPPSPTLLGKLKELNFRPVHVYGLTETYGPHTVCELARGVGRAARRRAGAAGRAPGPGLRALRSRARGRRAR